MKLLNNCGSLRSSSAKAALGMARVAQEESSPLQVPCLHRVTLRALLAAVSLAIGLFFFPSPVCAQTGDWHFSVAKDRFDKDYPIDLRSLNEKEAGQNGWMYVKDGKLYVPGQGRPFRAWCGGMQNPPADKVDYSYVARKLAKMGFNQMRIMTSGINASAGPKTPAAKITDIDRAKLDAAHRYVAAMKKEGIYTALCYFWLLGFSTDRAEWGVPKGNAAAFFWCEDLQAIMKEWIRQIMTIKSPYTGRSLAEDPALNIVELQNEENLFWFAGLSPKACAPECWQKLQGLFAAWAERKYGSLKNAYAAWKLSDADVQKHFAGDNLPQRRLEIAEVWLMARTAAERNPQLTPRMGDQIAFLAELEQKFNREMARFIREDLRYKGIVIGGNWQTCDDTLRRDLEDHNNAIPQTPMTCYHHYSSSWHANPADPRKASWGISKGDYYCDLSVLSSLLYMPTLHKRIRGAAQAAGEIGLPAPNRYQLEGTLAMAAHASMLDMDLFHWYHVPGAGLENVAIGKFEHELPHLLWHFPGAALLYRRGDVKEAPVVAFERRSLGDICQKELPMLANARSGDPLYRQAGQTAIELPSALEGGIDPLAYFVGGVEVEIGEPSERKVDEAALKRCIHREQKRVESVTGELAWDWGKRTCLVNTPRAQGVVGNLAAAGAIALKDLTIDSGNDPGSVLVIALDDAPLAQSRKILTQAVAESYPEGWQTAPAEEKTLTIGGKEVKIPEGAKRILSLGRMPYRMLEIAVKVAFKDGRQRKATALDNNGYPVKKNCETSTSGGDFIVTMPKDAIYVVLE